MDMTRFISVSMCAKRARSKTQKKRIVKGLYRLTGFTELNFYNYKLKIYNVRIKISSFVNDFLVANIFDKNGAVRIKEITHII